MRKSSNLAYLINGITGMNIKSGRAFYNSLSKTLNYNKQFFKELDRLYKKYKYCFSNEEERDVVFNLKLLGGIYVTFNKLGSFRLVKIDMVKAIDFLYSVYKICGIELYKKCVDRIISDLKHIKSVSVFEIYFDCLNIFLMDILLDVCMLESFKEICWNYRFGVKNTELNFIWLYYDRDVLKKTLTNVKNNFIISDVIYILDVDSRKVENFLLSEYVYNYLKSRDILWCEKFRNFRYYSKILYTTIFERIRDIDEIYMSDPYKIEGKDIPDKSKVLVMCNKYFIRRFIDRLLSMKRSIFDVLDKILNYDADMFFYIMKTYTVSSFIVEYYDNPDVFFVDKQDIDENTILKNIFDVMCEYKDLPQILVTYMFKVFHLDMCKLNYKSNHVNADIDENMYKFSVKFLNNFELIEDLFYDEKFVKRNNDSLDRLSSRYADIDVDGVLFSIFILSNKKEVVLKHFKYLFSDFTLCKDIYKKTIYFSVSIFYPLIFYDDTSYKRSVINKFMTRIHRFVSGHIFKSIIKNIGGQKVSFMEGCSFCFSDYMFLGYFYVIILLTCIGPELFMDDRKFELLENSCKYFEGKKEFLNVNYIKNIIESGRENAALIVSSIASLL